MKLHKREPRPRLRSVDAMASPEVEKNPFSELEALLTPEIRTDLEKTPRPEQASAELILAAEVLNQALKRPIDIQWRDLAEQHTKHPEELVRLISGHPSLPEMDSFSVSLLAMSLRLFPQERNQAVVSDALWQKGIDFSASKEAQRKQTYQQKVELLFSLLILRPDKEKSIQEFVQGQDVFRIIWETKKVLSGGDATLAAQLMILNPEFILTEEEKQKFVQEFKEASTVDLIHPSLIGWANLAILLAPSVEVNSSGQVVLGKKQGKMAESKPLPSRLAV